MKQEPPRKSYPPSLYVGNLAYSVTEEELCHLFARHGQVIKAELMRDQQSGKSKGFGFVEMAKREMYQDAMQALNGKELKGREMRIRLAEKRDSPKPNPASSYLGHELNGKL